MSSSRPLKGWDLATWRLAAHEPSLRSTMVGVLVVEGRVDKMLVMARIAAAAATQSQLRSVLETSGDTPLVNLIDEVDVRRCVLWLPPATDPHRAAIAAAKQDFADGQPLWRLRVIEQSERTYFIGSLHHCISDGNGAWRLMATLLDGMTRSSGAGDEKRADSSEEINARVKALLLRLLSDPMAVAGDTARLAQSALRLLAPRTEAHSALAARSADFESAWLRISLKGQPERARAAHHHIAAAVVLAFADFAKHRGIEITQVLANVPVAVQKPGAEQANQLVVARLTLPATTTDEIVKASRSELRQWRGEPAIALADDLASLSTSLPIEMLVGAVKQSDVTVSTLPAVPAGLTIDLKPVSAILPSVPPVGAALAVTTIPLGAELNIGASWDQSVLDKSVIEFLRVRLLEVFGAEVTLLANA